MRCHNITNIDECITSSQPDVKPLFPQGQVSTFLFQKNSELLYISALISQILPRSQSQEPTVKQTL